MKRACKSVLSMIVLMAMLLGFIPVLPGAVMEVSAVERKTYKHVVVVGIDGMGNYNQKTSTPNIDKIFKNNPKAAWTDYAMAANPNISSQCWTSMLTGVKPEQHGNNNDKVEDQSFTYNQPDYPTLFKLIRQSRPEAKMACYSSWIGPANGMVEAGLNVDTLWTKYDDAALVAGCESYIKENKPDFFFCVFNDVDATGHSKNWGSAEQMAALTKVDGYLGRVYQAVVDAGMLEDTLFICTTDHGGWTNGHGVRTESTKYCFWGAVGETVMPNTQLYLRGRDLAAVVGYAMNIQSGPNWDCYIPQYLFADNPNPPYPHDPQTLTAGRGNRATPASGLDDYIGNYVNMDKLGAALFFDDEVKDFTGKQTAVANGNVVYETGYFGKGVNLENGYISLPNLKMGTDSFTIGLWMKQTDKYTATADPLIFSNKKWGAGNGATDGVVFTEWGQDPAFRVSANNVNSQHRPDYPDEAQTVTSYDTSGSSWVAEGYHNCWVHVLLVVDRPANKVKVYYNFALAGEYTMGSHIQGISFDTAYPFNIGQDATGAYSVKLKSRLDDFLFFNGTLSDDEITNLRKYYTPVSTGSAPTRASVWTEKKQYNAGENVRFYSSADGYSTTLWIYAPDGSSVHYKEVSSPFTTTFTVPGQYKALVQTWNGKGSFTSQEIYFTVGNPPADGTVVTSKDLYEVDETVLFTIFGNADRTDLHIERADGQWKKTVENAANTYELGFGWAGTYCAYVVTTNNLGVTAGPKTYFVVGSPTTATITFKDWDGSIISEKTYGYGETVVPPENPTQPGNIFNGWDRQIVPVEGDAVYTAVYLPDTVTTYTVIFKNWDGSVISTDTYRYGVVIKVPEDPTRAADDNNTYTFTGWDKEVSATCTGDATYTAQFAANKIGYTVVFKDWDGSVISTENYGYGETVTVPDAPDRVGYTFIGWDREITAVNGDAVYTAQYQIKKFVITFKNWNGDEISADTYEYGAVVTPPTDPTRAADETNTYTFIGWDKEITPALDTVIYTARYKETKIGYTVIFKNWDGSVISRETYNFGDTVAVPNDPAREADETNTYTFAGWDTEVSATCTGDATYTAQYSATKIVYTVVFKNWDDTVISTNTYHYGDDIVFPEEPARPDDENYYYTFSGWSRLATTCKGDATYVALFTPTVHTFTVTFLDWDGTVISERVHSIHAVVYIPDEPVREGYVFAGWDKEVDISCTGDATYTATYVKEDLPTYTVTFKNWDGTVISERVYNVGDTIDIPEDPTRDADETYTYAFIGWDKEVSDTCTGDATYTAQFSETKIAYTVIFKDWDGTVISEETYYYGDEVVIPEVPVREGYIFMGWDQIVDDNCKADAVYTATYEEEDIDVPAFTLGDVNDDGEIDISDFVQLKAHLLGKSQLTGNNVLAADVNVDGEVDISDFVLLKSHLLGKTQIGA